MQIYKHSHKSFDIKRIDFCCSDMSSGILKGIIRTANWDNKPVILSINDCVLSFCPYCGEMVEHYNPDSGE